MKVVKKDYPVAPVSFSDVNLTDQFWAPRLAIQKKVMVPFALDKTQPAVDNLSKTAEFLKGKKDDLPFPHRFISSDLYKVMEGAAYLLKVERDDELENQIDDIIDIIGAAQEEDGYLYVAHTCGISNPVEMGEEKYSWVIHSHELYNIGHMIEGAVAYFEATGKKKWLEISEKSAKHINKVFFEGDENYNNGEPINQAPGHQELEMALCRLYRATGNELYLTMSKKFLDIRGVTFKPEGEGIMSPSYAQQHAPVKDQTEAVGHAVRAAYQYAAMADVSALTGSKEYLDALDKIWDNIVNTRMHITGGLGAIHGIEGFGDEYDLPNMDAYNETCAAIANVFFNHRMCLLKQDAKYMDVAEVSLFNNSLAGMNHDGNRFFYVNPLEADGYGLFNHGSAGRTPWFDCACCPSNLARIMNHVGGYMYAQSEEDIFVLLYSQNESEVEFQGSNLVLKQETLYPYDGAVRLSLGLEEEKSFGLKLRIPSWLGKQFVPGKLYRYADQVAASYAIKVNGVAVETTVQKGFATIHRTWNDGDQIELVLEMPVRLNECSTKVKDNIDRLAITRGPLIYCAEGIDNEGAVQRFFLENKSIESGVERIQSDDLFNGVPKLTLKTKSVEADACEMKMIPYMDWNNRGNHSMIIWMPTSEKMAREQLERKLFDESLFGDVMTSSNYEGEIAENVCNGKRPQDSKDMTIPRWSSVDSEKQFFEMVFPDQQKVERLGVFWAEDESLDAPESWTMEYYDGSAWHAFDKYITDVFGVTLNKYNTVHPAADLTCKGLRLNIKPQQNKRVGLLDLDLTVSQN